LSDGESKQQSGDDQGFFHKYSSGRLETSGLDDFDGHGIRRGRARATEARSRQVFPDWADGHDEGFFIEDAAHSWICQ
jgi:hypothetical protein